MFHPRDAVTSLTVTGTGPILRRILEYARYACCLAEAALAACREERWAFAQLAEIDTWFAGLVPALATDLPTEDALVTRLPPQ